MSLFSLDDLTTPLTRQEVEASIYDVLGIVGVNTTTWKPGAVVRTMITGCSIVLSAFSSLTAIIARSGFLELSEGDWLTLVARHVYGVERLEATFAEGEITLVNAGGGIFSLDPDDLVVSNAEGQTYRNTALISLGAGATVTAPIRATEAGSDSTTGAGTITEIVTPAMLNVTCSNALAVVGRDAEGDAALRTRCSEKLGSLSPFGPPDAYSFAARNATLDDGNSAGVTRVRLTKDGAGGVTVYVADASGELEGDIDDTSTALGAVDDAVQRLAAPLAVNAITASASPVEVPVTYAVRAYNTMGLTNAQLADAIEEKLAQFMQSQPIGGHVVELDPGKLFRSAIAAAIASVRSEILDVQITLPASDQVLDIDEVPVLGAVTATITQVPPGEGF